jgi:hypothetical protein
MTNVGWKYGNTTLLRQELEEEQTDTGMRILKSDQELKCLIREDKKKLEILCEHSCWEVLRQ